MTNDATSSAAGETIAGTRPSKRAQNPKPQPPRRCATEEEGLAASNAAPQASLIVLALRPNGHRFNGNRVERAQEAGFSWLKHHHLIGLSDPDTGNEVARHVVSHTDEALGNLQEIQVHIDPQRCAWMWQAGSQLMERLKLYAVLIGAHICDGLEQRLDDDAVDAIGQHIDGVMTERRKAYIDGLSVTLPSGEQRELSELTFAYTVVREAGMKKGLYRNVWFDAPALHHYEGRAKGLLMAGEIVQFIQNHNIQKLRLDAILREAFERSNGNRFGSYNKAEASNVCRGFLDCIETLIEVGARHLNPKWLENQVAEARRNHESWAKHREERKAEFVARMKAARTSGKKKGGKA